MRVPSRAGNRRRIIGDGVVLRHVSAVPLPVFRMSIRKTKDSAVQMAICWKLVILIGPGIRIITRKLIIIDTVGRDIDKDGGQRRAGIMHRGQFVKAAISWGDVGVVIGPVHAAAHGVASVS